MTKGRAREFVAFGWDPAAVPDPQDPATFERSRLDWSEPDREPAANLAGKRRELPLTCAGRRLELASAAGVDLGEAAVGLPPMSAALLVGE